MPQSLGDVEPLAGVGRPRIGALYTAQQMAARRVGSCPKAERPVYAEPDVVAMASVDDVPDGADGVHGAPIDVARLCAHDRRSAHLGENGLEGPWEHAAGVVHVDGSDGA